MKIILKAILYIGVGLYHVSRGIKFVGEWLEEFATKKLNG
jgi:hypothetical protein